MAQTSPDEIRQHSNRITVLFDYLKSDLFYFLSAVLWGGALNGLFTILVEQNRERWFLLIRITLLLCLWASASFVQALHLDQYKARSEGASPADKEKIQKQTVKPLVCWFFFFVLLSVLVLL